MPHTMVLVWLVKSSGSGVAAYPFTLLAAARASFDGGAGRGGFLAAVGEPDEA